MQKVRTSDSSSTIEASAVHFNVFARRCDLCDRRDRIKDSAERRAGEMLREMAKRLERHSGRGDQNGFHVGLSVNLR